jgi:hypothetical protein
MGDFQQIPLPGDLPALATVPCKKFWHPIIMPVQIG